MIINSTEPFDVNGTSIERASAADAELVMTMVREIAAHQSQSDTVTTSVARWAELLASPDVIVLIARLNSNPVGYVSCIRRLHLWTGGDILALDDLYVREEARNRRVGAALMNQLAEEFAAPENLTITWGVQPDNEGAIRFYHRLGATLRAKVLAAWTPT